MRIVSVVAVLLIGAIVLADAQGLPSNYKVQFENAWVRVTEVRYAPLEKVRAHAHTPYPSAYVYLNDGPPVVFKHVGGKAVAATRAATKAGAFRVYKGLEEIHEAENTGNTPSEFLRVEFKTAPSEPATFFGKFERPATPSASDVVHFNHAQVRISRLWIAPGQSIDVASASEPVLLIALAPGAGLGVGESKWIDASSRARLTNAAAASIDLLRVDFKTRPVETRR
ncbi:MAG TPA: hypothetical protein VFZ31_16795 [Vicinamibacterales bacterium]